MKRKKNAALTSRKIKKLSPSDPPPSREQPQPPLEQPPKDVTLPATSASPTRGKKPDTFFKNTYTKKNKCRLEGGRKVTASRRRPDNVNNEVAPSNNIGNEVFAPPVVVNNEVDKVVNEVLVNLNVDYATEDQDEDKTGTKSPSMHEGDVDSTSDGSSDGSSDVDGSVDDTTDDGDESGGTTDDGDENVCGNTDDGNKNVNGGTMDGDEDIDDGGWRLVRPVEGGPENISILTGYRGHVAYKIWKNEEREVLQSNTRFKILSSWKLPDGDAWVTKVKETGLIHLSA